MTGSHVTDTFALPTSVLTLVPRGLGLLDAQLRYLWVNDLLAHYNDKPAADHVGRTVDEVAPGVGEAFLPLLNRVLRTGPAAVGVEVATRPA